VKNVDLAADGKRFAALMAVEGPEAQQAQNHVIFLENFLDELRRRGLLRSLMQATLDAKSLRQAVLGDEFLIELGDRSLHPGKSVNGRHGILLGRCRNGAE
jgi:hypothetical protein